MPLRRNRLAAVLAMLSMALLAFWPLISQARPVDPSLLVPVCSVDGTTHYIDLATGKPPGQEPAALHGDHCKLCVFGGERTQLLPSAPVEVFQSPAQVAETPAAFCAADYRSTSVSPAQARAPPVRI